MPPPPVLLEHPSSLAHDTGPHPERAERIVAILAELERHDFLGFERRQSPAAERSSLIAVHPETYVDSIEAFARGGGGHLDLDTVMSAGSYEAALHAAGGAVTLVDLLLDGAVPTGFSIHRPPGHHATADRAMGFCLFNNVAVAVQHALDHRGLERVLVLDWDVHHGNGTNDIFHSSDQVLFVSIHQSPLYPGTGPAGDVGSGRGVGFTVNLPVPPGAGDALYLSLVEQVVGPLAIAFEPQLVLISAGYDAHRDDPLASCQVSEDGFAGMARTMRDVAASVQAPLGCVLEGGYALGPLANSVAATMRALVDRDDGTREVVESAPARDARARLARWWPSLSG